MIIIKKKRILFICIIVIVSIFTYFGMSKKKIIQTSGIVNKDKVVIVDPRAWRNRPDGSVGNNGTIESEINLKISLKLKELLEQANIKVILTRTDENGISEIENGTIRQKHVADLKKRVSIGNNSGANIFVSIHLNKISDEKYSGWQTFYKKNNEKSKKLANVLQDTIRGRDRKRE